MSALHSVRTTVTVTLPPEDAFAVFTGEIETWYRRGVTTVASEHSERGVALRIECGPAGRVLRVDNAGTETPIATITTWEPGRRLCFVDRHDTEVEVTFDETPEGTPRRARTSRPQQPSRQRCRNTRTILVATTPALVRAPHDTFGKQDDMTTPRYRFTGVTPYLFYEDANAMLDWLANTLGFVERSRFVDANGVVQQAEMLIGDQQLWFSGHGPGYWESKGHRPHQLTLIWVDDVDAHHAHAVAAGAIAEPPEDQTWGVRNYQLTDPEGYMWGFMTSLDTGYIQIKSAEEGGLTEIRPSTSQG